MAHIYVVKGPDGPMYFTMKSRGQAIAAATDVVINHHEESDIKKLHKATATFKIKTICEALEDIGVMHVAEVL